MRTIGSVLAVLAFTLACGGGGTDVPEPLIVDVAPTPTPTPEPVVAPTPAPAGSRCPDGVVSAGVWQGEYPGPVVDVKAKVSVPGRAKACDASPSGPCTVAPGLYHPWSMNTTASFDTLRAVQKFKVRRAYVYTVDDTTKVSFKEGDVITIPAYYGEGFCAWEFGDQGWTNECPEMVSDDAGEIFEALPEVAFTEIQLLQVTCGEGHEAWIDVDAALFALAEVEEGVITGYGEVGPAGSEGIFE